jgi:DHA3 family macrolide efflux protein-like MFS transporter
VVAVSPFAGVLVDRWNRKVLIGMADFLQAMSTVVLIFFFWQGAVPLFAAFALLTMRGVFQAFHAPAVSAIVPLMIPKEKLSRMNGLNYLASGAVSMIGPVVGAILYSLWPMYETLLIDVVTFLIAVVPLLAIKIPTLKILHEKSSFFDEFRKGFSFIANTRGMLPLLFLATALNFLLTPMSTQLSYFVNHDHLGEAPEYALVGAALQLGMIAGGIAMTVTKGFKRKMVAAACFIFVIFIAYALVALTPTGWFWFMAIGMAILGVSLPIANVSTQTIFQTVVPPEMQGRVTSVIMALASAATPVGMILSGVIVEFVHTASLFLGCAVTGMLIIAAAWFLTNIRQVERLELQADTEATRNPS